MKKESQYGYSMTDFILMMGSVFAIITFCYVGWSRLDNQNKIKQETQNIYFLNLSLEVLKRNPGVTDFNDTKYLIQSGAIPEGLVLPNDIKTLKNLWGGDVFIESIFDSEENRNFYQIKYTQVPPKACTEIAHNVYRLFYKVYYQKDENEPKIKVINHSEKKEYNEKLIKALCETNSENTLYFIN